MIAEDKIIQLIDRFQFLEAKMSGDVAGADIALVNQRYGENSRAAIAIANGRGVDLELDVATRSLQARYNVDLNSADLCAVGLGELGRKSAVSAVLIPV